MTKENKFKIGLCLQGIALSLDEVTFKANEERLKVIEDIIAGEQEPCEDVISRQAVMDCFKKWQPRNGVFIGIWIPIDADNMPKEGEEVLFTVAKDAFYDEPTVLSGWFVSKYQEFEIDDEGRSVKLEDVVAWMPLPEPYKAESEGEK